MAGGSSKMPSPGNYGPSYQDYLLQGGLYHGVQVYEGGGMEFTPQYTEAEWNALSALDRYGAFFPNSVDPSFYMLGDDDPLAQQFRQQFGRNENIDNSGFQENNQMQTGLAIGYNNDENGVAGPQYGRLDWNQLAIDPTRLMWIDPEGTPYRRYVYELGNQRGDMVAQEQARNDDSGLGDNFPLIGLLTVLGGGMLANSFMGAGAGAAGEVPVGGMLSESVAPTVTETMVGSPWEIAPGFLSESVAPQVTEPMALNPFEAPIVAVEPPLTESTAPVVTEPMVPSPFDTPWWQDILDLGRDLLPGGSGGGQGGGVLALGGEAPRIGDHAQINDPYGLMASGWGPWSGLLDTPKGKVVDALAKRQRTRGI